MAESDVAFARWALAKALKEHKDGLADAGEVVAVLENLFRALLTPPEAPRQDAPPPEPSAPRDAEPGEKPRDWRHDCEDWRDEGIGCARCNPIAREIATIDRLCEDIERGVVRRLNGIMEDASAPPDAEALRAEMRRILELASEHDFRASASILDEVEMIAARALSQEGDS